MLLFDIETDGLLDQLTKIHCITLIGPGETRARIYHDTPGIFRMDGVIADALVELANADRIGGHNVIGFDVPAIQKLHPQWAPQVTPFDTMVACRLIWPDMFDRDLLAARKRTLPPEWKQNLNGSHSLKAWGLRLGKHKGDYDGGWETFTPEMAEYALQDAVVTEALYARIQAVGYNTDSLDLEMRVAELIAAQERHGFAFDKAAAEELVILLERRKAELGDKLRATFGSWVAPVMKGGRPYVFVPKRDNARLGYKAGVGVPKFQTLSFNPSSRQHIADRLKVLFGWQPTEFTSNGQPKVDETTLSGLDYPEAKLLVEYLTVEKRLGALVDGKQAWLNQVREDGRMHGRVNTLGAVTRRMTHSDPNVAQVPAVKKNKQGIRMGSDGGFGYECRSLFMASEGKVLVGCDAAGLELRMLAHYLSKTDGGAYARTVVEGKSEDGTDVHTVNQKVAGLNSRDPAKTLIYAYLYGAGNLKIGTIVYDDMTDSQREAFNRRYEAGSARERALIGLGTRLRRRLEEGTPGLKELQEKVKRLAVSGYLPALDGGRLRVRSAHAALNTLLQGNGAVLMKKALVLFIGAVEERGYRFDPVRHLWVNEFGFTVALVANIHDELQIECDPEIAEAVGVAAADAIRRAGEELGCRCPMAGEWKTGATWAETH